MVECKIGDKSINLVRGDITAMEIDAFVFDITDDLKLGSGFGSAIQQRGGVAIQQELDAIGKCPTGEAVVTDGGLLQAKYIIHTNGPKFREADEEGKLRNATRSALQRAEEKGVKRLAFPPIGTGLYQVPLDLCVNTMIDTISEHLRSKTCLEEVVLVAVDSREYEPFRKKLEGGV